MSEQKSEYVPFGEEWEKEVSKLSKANIIKIFGDKCKEVLELKAQLSAPNTGKVGVWRPVTDIPPKRHNYHVKMRSFKGSAYDYLFNTTCLFDGQKWVDDINVKQLSSGNTVELWLDETSSPISVGDGWTAEKPEIKENCILLVASYHRDNWDVTTFEILEAVGENKAGESAWYWSVMQDDDEWGDFEDIHGQFYKIISFPPPPVEQKLNQ